MDGHARRRRLRARHLAAAAVVGALAAGAAWLALRSPAHERLTSGELAAPRDLAVRQPPAGRPALVWAVGDAADDSGAGRPLAALVARDRPTRLLYLGDVYERGTAREFAEHYDPLYGALAARTSPTIGNHEWAQRAQGYAPYWRRAHGREPAPWYAFGLAGWEVLALSSEADHGPRSEQVRWLRDRVASGGDCRLAFWHRPFMSAGAHGDQEDVRPLWDALRGRAVLVLGAHDHDLQRFRPRDGITLLVAGAGGRELRDVDEDDPRLAFAAEGVHGGVRLRLAPGRADVEVVADDGRVLDRTVVRCGRR